MVVTSLPNQNQFDPNSHKDSQRQAPSYMLSDYPLLAIPTTTMSSQPSWPPSQNCTLQPFCSIYCPQWCSSLLPPPAPPRFYRPANRDSPTGPTITPLLIALIALSAASFIIVSCYTLFFRHCLWWRPSSTPNAVDTNDNAIATDIALPLIGLDEALINKIAVHTYCKGEDSLVGSTECSVCLSEFREEELLRLLPNCRHPFHIQCIDTWLRYHPNCPLCRVSVLFADQPTVVAPAGTHGNQTASMHLNVGLAIGTEGRVQSSSGSSASIAMTAPMDWSMSMNYGSGSGGFLPL